MIQLIDLLRTLVLDLFTRLGFSLFPRLPGFGPKIVSSCDFADTRIPETIPDGPRVLGPADTQGTIVADTINLPPRQSIALDGTLVLIARGDIRIESDIRRANRQNLRDVRHIAIVSLAGVISVGRSATVGGGQAYGPPDLKPRGPRLLRPPLLVGQSGFAGAVTMIRAPVIEIAGAVIGEDGGDGAEADLSRLHRFHSGVSYGGWGGFGGDVALCSEEFIDVKAGSVIRAGKGGAGGSTRAKVGTYGRAIARGGRGATGGDVRVVGTSPRGKSLIRVEPGALPGLVGGEGGTGGDTSASQWGIIALRGPVGPSNGGSAFAYGGAGGQGGTVVFDNSHVEVNVPARIHSGNGQRAGDALALGGEGGTRTDGLSGGFALALGGFGGPPGDTPRVPMVDGSTGRGDTGNPARGGDAEAEGGKGGDAEPAPIGVRNGGDSGAGVARGGLHGDNTRDADLVIRRPVAPRPGGGLGLQGTLAKSSAPR